MAISKYLVHLVTASQSPSASTWSGVGCPEHQAISQSRVTIHMVGSDYPSLEERDDWRSVLPSQAVTGYMFPPTALTHCPGGQLDELLIAVLIWRTARFTLWW